MARSARILSLAVFAASTSWLLWLKRAGGVDVFLGSVHLRSHDPTRFVLIAGLSAVVCVLTGGIGMIARWVRAATNHRAFRRLDRLATPLALAMSVAVVLTAITFRTRFQDETAVRALDAPLAIYHCSADPATVYLFDLTPSAVHGRTRDIHESNRGRLRFAPAGPATSLTFARR